MNKKEKSDLFDNLTLVDDVMMSSVFNNNKELAQLVVRIILERNDIIVKSVKTQVQMSSPNIDGRKVWLDILAVDSEDNFYNIEVQNYKSGADVHRQGITVLC